MPSEKRDRQRANREAARAEAEAKERRARWLRNGRNGAIIAAVVIIAGVLFSLSRSDDESTSTTGAADETESTAASDTTVASDTTTAVDTTAPQSQTTAPFTTMPEGAVDSLAYVQFRALPVACGGDLPEPAAEMSFDAPGDAGVGDGATATFATSCGDIVVELDTENAPEAVNSLAFLAGEGYFDGTVSHRISPGFVFQAGDPTATGTGGPGYNFADELPPDDFVYERGVLAMANSGPDTNGSQFFLVFQDSPLPPNFTPFGRVIEGLDVLDRLEQVPVNGETPLEAVYLERVVVG